MSCQDSWEPIDYEIKLFEVINLRNSFKVNSEESKALVLKLLKVAVVLRFLKQGTEKRLLKFRTF